VVFKRNKFPFSDLEGSRPKLQIKKTLSEAIPIPGIEWKNPMQ
jgi:hypothetical protein